MARRIKHIPRRYIDGDEEPSLAILIMIIVLMICFIFSQFIYCELPYYATNICNQKMLDIELMEAWSYAETTHCANQVNNYYGRYSIGRACYLDYCRLNKKKPVSNWQAWLSDDSNNCEVAYWLANYRVIKQKWSYAYFFQTWLFGLYNVKYCGRWSDTYSNLIWRGK